MVAGSVALVLAMTMTHGPPWLYVQLAALLDGYVSALVIARVLNVLLFVPLGIAIGRWGGPRWLWAAVALSVGVEFTQSCSPRAVPTCGTS